MLRFENISIQLVSSNDSLLGHLTLFAKPRDVSEPEVGSSLSEDASDPRGAGAFVVVVLFVYSASVIFLIASRTCLRHREESADPQIQSAKRFFEQAPTLRERNARESYRKLKHSVIPVVAQSGARDLVSRRKSFMPILAAAGVPIDLERRASRAASASRCDRLHVIDEVDETAGVHAQRRLQPRTSVIGSRRKMPSRMRVMWAQHLQPTSSLDDVTSAFELNSKTTNHTSTC